jgi:hypothetical protein
MVVVVACEPGSPTEAHDQLARGPSRQVTYSIPITQDTFTVGEFLGDDTTTTPDGLLAITMDPETLGVSVGERLQFSNVTFTRLKIDVPAGVGPGSAAVSGGYQALANEPRLQAVDSVVIRSGTLTITTRNRLPGTLIDTLTLTGFRDSLNNVLRTVDTIPAAPGDGSYTADSVSFNLAGVRIRPPDVNITLSGTVNLASTTTTAVDDSSIIQSGAARLVVVERLRGPLDPAVTPELVIAVEESAEIPRSSVDFGQLEDAIEDSRLNDARLAMTVRNTSQAPFALSNFTLGVVKLTPTGQIPRDGSNNPVYEVDSLGAVRIAVTDTGQATLTIARAQTKTVTFQTARLIDRVVHLLLDNERAAVVGAGTVRVGDGADAAINRRDSVNLTLGMTVALDFTIPTAGVGFDTVTNGDGMGLDSAEADDLADLLDSASARLLVTNGTPFGLDVRLASVPDTLPAGVRADSVFRWARNLSLDSIGPVLLAPAPSDAQGRATAPIVDTVDVRLTGAQARTYFGEFFGSGTRIRLLPGTGNRGAIRSTDKLILNARALVWVRVGGN